MADPEADSGDIIERPAETVAEEVTPELGRFIGTIFGSASIEFDRMLGDRIGWWRFKQAVRLAKKAHSLCEAEGIVPGEVPLRVSVPLLERGSLADDPDLTDRYAALLANAAGSVASVQASFSVVLSELEPSTAKLLDVVYDQEMTIAPELRPEFSVRTELERSELGFSRDQYQAQLDDLVRLGLLRTTPNTPRELDDDVYRWMSLTSFGRAFVAACRPPGTRPPEVFWRDRGALEKRIYATEPVQRALERLGGVLRKNGTVREALVGYIVREGCVSAIRDLAADTPHALPLRNVARCLATLGFYDDAVDVASHISNLQERTKLGTFVMQDLASRSESTGSPRQIPRSAVQLLHAIYAAVRDPQRRILKEMSDRYDLAVDWPAVEPNP